MTYFHQLWSRLFPLPAFPSGLKEIQTAHQINTNSEREGQFIDALGSTYLPRCHHHLIRHPRRSLRSRAMRQNRLRQPQRRRMRRSSTPSPFLPMKIAQTKPTPKQKRARTPCSEPLYHIYPQHPGIPRTISSTLTSNTELAPKMPCRCPRLRIRSRLPLRMPCTCLPTYFTQLGMYGTDSIPAKPSPPALPPVNRDDMLAAEELHAMDYPGLRLSADQP